QVKRHQRAFPELRAMRIPKVRSLRAFDDAYTAPLHGFADAMDYYERSSAGALAGRIRVPTFILTARDDPFVCADSFEKLPRTDALKVHILPHGGHLGFLGWDGAGGIRWAERRIAEWILASARAQPVGAGIRFSLELWSSRSP